jgi:hypothetical protein
MIRNKELSISIQKSAKVIFQFYNETLAIDEQRKSDQVYMAFLRHSINILHTQVEKFPEFQDSLRIMTDDNHIKQLENKWVGSLSSTKYVQSLSNYLITFFNDTYLKSTEYSEAYVDSEYKRFEDLAYESELIKLDTVKLYNFSFSKAEIDLGNGVKIVNYEEGTVHEEPAVIGRYRYFSRSPFSIERKYKTRKIVSTDPLSSTQFVSLSNKELTKSEDVFNFAITALRLLKPSAVYRDQAIESKVVSYLPSGGIAMTASPFPENIVIGDKCEVNEIEVNSLTTYFNYIINEKDKRFGVAIRRLASGVEKRNKEDRLVDYMVGLGTLFLPDGNTELSFRLSLRVAFLLRQEKEQRKVAFKFLRDMYSLRSQIVHGNSQKLTDEQVIGIEGMLRESIILWITDKTNFLDKLSNGQDGKLNTLFFDS